MSLTIKDVDAKLNTHEAVCAERWKETVERIKRLEMILIGSAGAVILLMAGMLWKLQGITMASGGIVEVFSAAWPVLVAIVMLIIVLAKMHGDLEVLKDKVKVLFDLWNSKQ